MKRGVSFGLTVAAVIIVVGFAGYIADRAHGRLEGLINGADDRPFSAPPAGLKQNGDVSTFSSKSQLPDPRPATTSTGAASGRGGLSPSVAQPKVDIGLRRGAADGFGGGGEGGE